ncbi:MAG: quaternary ammonium transporter [Timaviella obliquedivisa GSE-PSE-MK23-08B]|jgi:osmoprotectant transport system substrate-binding protein|nr:quaternary ammonium transporter [Timaviella obliquedivisa GSE-PSE-MK23-08B]
MKRLHRILLLPLLAFLTMGILIACANSENNPQAAIKVGSKDFTEQLIVGEMYALTLEQAGFTVERKLNLGGTPVAQAALESNEIDLYPEYTGTGLLTVLKLPALSDPREVLQAVSKGYQQKYNLTWLDPAPMNNTQALAMTEVGAKKFGIRTISQMAAKASELTLIGPPEFEVREDGLPGIKAKYGNFELKEYKSVDAGLRYKGLVDGEADVAVAFGTDGEIGAFNLIVLEDDKQLFPPYQIAPIVRQETLDANPNLAAALNALAPKLTTEVMQRLNYEVSGKQRESIEVAREFLLQEGVIKG